MELLYLYEIVPKIAVPLKKTRKYFPFFTSPVKYVHWTIPLPYRVSIGKDTQDACDRWISDILSIMNVEHQNDGHLWEWLKTEFNKARKEWLKYYGNGYDISAHDRDLLTPLPSTIESSEELLEIISVKSHIRSIQWTDVDETTINMMSPGTAEATGKYFNDILDFRKKFCEEYLSTSQIEEILKLTDFKE